MPTKNSSNAASPLGAVRVDASQVPNQRRGRASKLAGVEAELLVLLNQSRNDNEYIGIQWSALADDAKRANERLRAFANRNGFGINVRQLDGQPDVLAFKATTKRTYN